MSKMDCFIAFTETSETLNTIIQLIDSELTGQVFVLASENIDFEDAQTLVCEHPYSTSAMKQIAEKASAEFVMVALQNSGLGVGYFALERMAQVAENTGAAMVYSDYYEMKSGFQSAHPVIDYQPGSLRDDFNFGPAQLFRTEVLKSFEAAEFQQAGFYALRLHAFREGELLRIPEFLFTTQESDTRKSGEKQFDYVSGSAREKQIEMEKVCTNHLKKIGALLKPPFKKVDFKDSEFPGGGICNYSCKKPCKNHKRCRGFCASAKS